MYSDYRASHINFKYIWTFDRITRILVSGDGQKLVMTYDRVLTLARTQLVIVYTKFLPRFSQKLSIESKPILVLRICSQTAVT